MNINFHFGFSYNEFKTHVRWTDYVGIWLFNFPILIWRRYDWMDKEESTHTFGFLGIIITSY